MSEDCRSPSLDRERLLDAALDLMPIGALLSDDAGEGRIIVNAPAARLLGLEQAGPRSLDCRSGATFVHRNGRRVALEDWLRHPPRRARGGSALELRVERGDGALCEVLATVTFLRDARGHRQGTVATLTDVTQSKALRGRAERRAWQWQTLARLGLRALSEPHIDQVMRRICARLPLLLGVEFSSLLRRLPDSRDLVLEEGVGWREGLVGRALIRTDGDATSTADGIALWREHGIVSSAQVTVAGPSGPYGVLGVHSVRPREFANEDLAILRAGAGLISHALKRERLAQELGERSARQVRVDTAQQIERASRLASLGTLAAGIAHEVNNPLNSVLMNAELGLMALASRDEPRVETVLRRIIEDCRRCAAITQSVLMSARADQPRLREPTDLNRVVRAARGVMASILHLSGLKIVLELEEDMPLIAANRTELEQVLVNLIQNAGEAGATRVTIATHRRADAVELVVVDDGPGVVEADLPRLFEPFFSGRRDRGGTGLGLSLVERIITDHRGTITARNRRDGGLEFVATLPLEAQIDESRTDRRG